MPAPKGKKTVNTVKEQSPHKSPDWQFKPGQSGNPNGRPKGSRNKLAESFLADVYESWKGGGAEALETVRQEKPDVYVKVVASVLPKELNVNHDVLGEMSMEELDHYAEVLQSIVDSAGQGEVNAGSGSKAARTTH